MNPAAHYALCPEHDHRTWLPLAQRGRLARGHTPGRCRACEAPASVAAPPIEIPADDDAPCPVVAPLPPPPPAARVRTVAARRAPRAPDPVPAPAAEPAAEPEVAAPPAPTAIPVVPSATVRESILLALADLGDGPVAISDLVVRAWEREPERFGLPGRALAHPSDNRVQAKLSGYGGLVWLGWCARPSQGAVEITPLGLRMARALARRAAR